MSDTSTFKTAASAVDERRKLLRDLRLGLVLALGLLCLALGKAPFPVQLAAWILALSIGWALWRLDGEGLVAPFASRQLRIQDQALEVIQGRFTRLLFFGQLEQLRMIQGADERVLEIQLRTLDGGVNLRGFENMELLFASLNAKKPPRVVIEVEERRFDGHDISSLSKGVFIAGGALLLLLLLLGPGDAALKRMSGLLLIGIALFVSVYQPFSHKKGKKAAIAEVAMGLVFILFGTLFLI